MFKRITVKGVSLSSAHHPNTLSLTIYGKEAYNITPPEIIDCLIKEIKISWKDVKALYQFEDPLKWFLKFGREAEQKHFENLHCKTFQVGVAQQISFEHVGRERRKVVVHWVPPTMPKEGVEEMLSFLSKENVEAHPHKGRPDRWTVLYRPDNEASVPHYIYLDCGQVKNKRVLLLVPGRRQACFLCGSQEHWTSKCGRKTSAGEGVGDKTGEGSSDHKDKPGVPATKPVAAPVAAPATAPLAAPVTVPVAVPLVAPVSVPVTAPAKGSTAEALPGPTPVLGEARSATPEEGWQIKMYKKNNNRKTTEMTEGGISPKRRSYADAVSHGSPPSTSDPLQKAWTATKRHHQDEDSETDEIKYNKYDWFPQDESTEDSG